MDAADQELVPLLNEMKLASDHNFHPLGFEPPEIIAKCLLVVHNPGFPSYPDAV